jgi:ketosteroid isomerase-like protein
MIKNYDKIAESVRLVVFGAGVILRFCVFSERLFLPPHNAATMHEPESSRNTPQELHELVERFYTAFQRLDWQTMGACYHDEATFTDEAFVQLNAAETRAMWQMLCTRAKNFELTFSAVQCDDARGSARWTAHYDYSASGRRVENNITAAFTFRDGKILTHRDSFSLWRWSRQALGAVGWVLGWSPMLRSKVQREARKALAQFMEKQSLAKQ